MNLTGEQRKAIDKALQRFNRDQLSELMSFRGVKLDDVTSGRSLESVRFELVNWAESHGRVVELLEVVADARANFPEIRTLALEIAAQVAGAQMGASADLASIQLQLPLGEIPSVGPLPAGSRMPHSPNPLFTGREEEMHTLAAHFNGEAGAAVVQPPVAATGSGGYGKTQLAAAFAHRYGRFFAGGVFWIGMADPNVVSTELAECAASMMNKPIEQIDAPVEQLVQLVQKQWAEPPRGCSSSTTAKIQSCCNSGGPPREGVAFW